MAIDSLTPATPDLSKKRSLKVPTAYTILALLIVAIALLTYVIPAGSFQYQDGSPVPGTYQAVQPNPQGVADILVAPINGMYGIQGADGQISIYPDGALYGAIGVALFVLMIGGFLGVTMKTGAIDAGIGARTMDLCSLPRHRERTRVIDDRRVIAEVQRGAAGALRTATPLRLPAWQPVRCAARGSPRALAARRRSTSA